VIHQFQNYNIPIWVQLLKAKLTRIALNLFYRVRKLTKLISQTEGNFW